MFKEEWKSFFSNRMTRITLVGLVIIPFIYGTVFLKSMWDPYGEMKNLPVAVVNLDQPVTKDGQTMRVGEDFVKNLKKAKSLNFQFVDEKKAEKELADGKYFMIVKIPRNFSASAASMDSAFPQKMNLDYTTTAGYNFVAEKMSESAVTKMREELNEEITGIYTQTIFSSIKEAGMDIEKAAKGTKEITDHLGTAKNGARQLADGINQAENGSGELANGLTQAQSGSSLLLSGASQANQGASKLKKGTKTNQAGVEQYTDGVNQSVDAFSKISDATSTLSLKNTTLTSGAKALSSGAATLSEKTGELASGMTQAQTGANNLSKGLDQLNQRMPMIQILQAEIESAENSLPDIAENEATKEMLQLIIAQMKQSTLVQSVQELDEGGQKLAASLQNVTDGTNELAKATKELATKSKELATGVNAYTAGVSKLKNGANTLTTSAKKLKEKSSDLVNGSKELAQGATTLSSGLNQLTPGAKKLDQAVGELNTGANTLNLAFPFLSKGGGQLDSGLHQLFDGSKELEEKLGVGAKQMIENGNPSKKEMEQLVAPVVTNHTEKTPVKNNRTGMTPYMVSIGLWVGSLSMCIAFDLIQTTKKPKSAIEWWAGKYSVLYVLGIVQGLVFFVGLSKFLGLEMLHPVETLLLMFCASLAFVSINGYLTMALGKVGNFLSLILLVLQLGSAGGTYPLPLSPKIFQVFHPFLPISHAVFGLRQSISVGINPILQMMILLGFAGVFMLLNYGRYARMYYGGETLKQ